MNEYAIFDALTLVLSPALAHSLALALSPTFSTLILSTTTQISLNPNSATRGHKQNQTYH